MTRDNQRFLFSIQLLDKELQIFVIKQNFPDLQAVSKRIQLEANHKFRTSKKAWGISTTIAYAKRYCTSSWKSLCSLPGAPSISSLLNGTYNKKEVSIKDKNFYFYFYLLTIIPFHYKKVIIKTPYGCWICTRKSK